MQGSAIKKQRNTAVQVLRLAACLLVLMVHVGQRMGLSGILRAITDFGENGVIIFFLISGFLAARSIWNDLNGSIKTYYIKRAIAVLPLYYLVIVHYAITENICNLYAPVIPADELGLGWLRYVFLLNGVLKDSTPFWSNIGFTWTIPVFCCFYFVAPLFLRRAKSICATILVWLFVLLGTRSANYLYPCPILANLHVFFLGAVICACVAGGKTAQLVLAAFLLAGSIVTAILQKMPQVYILLLACLVLAMTAMKTLRLPQIAQRLVDTLDHYSYTFYLVQGVLFTSVIDKLSPFNLPKPVTGIILVGGLVLLTWFVNRFMEKPLQGLLRKWLLHQ